jgi:hypothetical protein
MFEMCEECVIKFENKYETLFNIDTRKKEMNNHLHYRGYEATPYYALEQFISRMNPNIYVNMVDFGSGKGRIPFFFNSVCSGQYIGVEYNYDIYINSIRNLRKYSENYYNKIQFVFTKAENYHIQRTQNYFYFFNPFSLKIFIKVFNNILNSYMETRREINLIFFSPPIEYIAFLESLNKGDILRTELDSPYTDEQDFFLTYIIN